MEKSLEATPAIENYIDVRSVGDEMEAASIVMIGQLSIFFWAAVAEAIRTMNWMPLANFARLLPLFAVIIGGVLLFQRFAKATRQNLRLESDQYRPFKIDANGELVFSDPISHAQITSIQWAQKSSDKKLMVEIQHKVTDPDALAIHVSPSHAEKSEELNLTLTETFNLRNFSTADRRLLVQYLSQIDVPQNHWDEFCYKFAQKWTENPKLYLGNGWLANQFKSAPLRTTALLSPLIMLRGAMSASYHLYWLMGITVLISTFINVRLIHGAWLPPIGTHLLAGGFGLILFGYVVYLFQTYITAPQSASQTVDADEQLISWLSGGLLMASLILVPLLMQLASIWKLSPQFGAHLLLLIPFSPLLPHFWQIRKRATLYRTDPDACHDQANRIWEASIRGILSH